jgi:hypothetical protein
MPIAWPVSLPQLLETESFGYAIGNTTLRSTVDQGFPKVRRQFTKSIDTITCSMTLTAAQYSTFVNFYDVLLNAGVGTFNFLHPYTGATMICRFSAPPTFRPKGNLSQTVSMTWEVLGA